MRVLICGGRTFGLLKRRKDNTWEPEGEKQYLFGQGWLQKRFEEYLPDPSTPDNKYGELTVIQGGAKGGDTIGHDFAVVNWLGMEEYRAEWDKHGKKAGILRNLRMRDEGKPDLVIAFPGGTGTAHMIKIAREAGIPVEEVKYETQVETQEAAGP